MDLFPEVSRLPPHPEGALVETSCTTVGNIPIITRIASEGPRFIPRLRFGLGFPPAHPEGSGSLLALL